MVELDEIIILIFHEISNMIRKKFLETPEKIPCVLSVPSNFTPSQTMRVAILANTSNFNCEDIIPSYFGSALMYGFENQPSFDLKNNKSVLLCDCGYTNLTLCFVKYKKSKMDVQAVYTTDKISGKLIDIELLKEFAPKIKKQVDIDIYNDPRAYLKVKKALISVKEKLSAAGADAVLII